jgi:hypothetical protein
MSLFVCDKCGCVDNTALGRYWSKDDPLLWGEDNLGLALCTECAPTKYANGEPVNPRLMADFGKWHNEFPKQKWDGKIEVINRK